MPNEDLVADFKRTLDQWSALGQALAPLAERLAVETVADALPAAQVIDVRVSSTRTGSAFCAPSACVLPPARCYSTSLRVTTIAGSKMP